MIDSFIAYITGIKRYSSRTAAVYRSVLSEFAAFAAVEEKEIKDALTPNVIRGYEVHLLDQKGEAATSVNLHLSVLSSFCRFLINKGMLDSNPVRLIPRPKTGKNLPSIFRENSMRDYFEKTQHYVDTEDMGMSKRYKGRLNRLIISILYNTGIRRSELINLKIGSIDFSRRVMRVRGKGDKMREIPLVASLCEEISLYLRTVESMVGCSRDAGDPLLITEKGTALYPVFVDRVIKSELGGVDGISGKKSPHVLRHTLATELLNEGADLNSIKELLGHSSLAATQIYTHNSIDKLKRVYNNAHPRAKSGGNYGDQDSFPEV